MISPHRLARAVVQRKKIMDAAVILPVVRAFPMEQIPMTMEQKTIGKDHHVQGVHVDTSDQTGHSEDRFKPSGQEKSCEDTQDQSCKDRTGNMLPVPGIKRFHLCVPS